jgi:GNAT superfamily N-acetyltransferase
MPHEIEILGRAWIPKTPEDFQLSNQRAFDALKRGKVQLTEERMHAAYAPKDLFVAMNGNIHSESAVSILVGEQDRIDPLESNLNTQFNPEFQTFTDDRLITPDSLVFYRVVMQRLLHNPAVLMVDKFLIREDFQRLGLGRAFYQQLRAAVAELGINHITGYNDRENIEFFKKIGRVPLSQIRAEYWQSLLPEDISTNGEPFNPDFYTIDFLNPKQQKSMTI